MSRIYVSLAAFSFLLVCAALLIGLSIGQLRPGAAPSVLLWASIHRLTGLAAALAVVFVNSIVVTYFIGTSRWTKEVAETYRLDHAYVEQSQQLKRQSFPWMLAGILAVLAVIALGAASDPATGRKGTDAWVVYHLLGGCATILIVGFSYVAAWTKIDRNRRIIDEVASRAREIRRQRLRSDTEPRVGCDDGVSHA